MQLNVSVVIPSSPISPLLLALISLLGSPECSSAPLTTCHLSSLSGLATDSTWCRLEFSRLIATRLCIPIDQGILEFKFKKFNIQIIQKIEFSCRFFILTSSFLFGWSRRVELIGCLVVGHVGSSTGKDNAKRSPRVSRLLFISLMFSNFAVSNWQRMINTSHNLMIIMVS